jgi:hypothetical protein
MNFLFCSLLPNLCGCVSFHLTSLQAQEKIDQSENVKSVELLNTFDLSSFKEKQKEF